MSQMQYFSHDIHKGLSIICPLCGGFEKIIEASCPFKKGTSHFISMSAPSIFPNGLYKILSSTKRLSLTKHISRNLSIHPLMHQSIIKWWITLRKISHTLAHAHSAWCPIHMWELCQTSVGYWRVECAWGLNNKWECSMEIMVIAGRKSIAEMKIIFRILMEFFIKSMLCLWHIARGCMDEMHSPEDGTRLRIDLDAAAFTEHTIRSNHQLSEPFQCILNETHWMPFHKLYILCFVLFSKENIEKIHCDSWRFWHIRWTTGHQHCDVVAIQ